MPKVIQILHIGRLQEKQAITVGISKILVGTKTFLPAGNIHRHELQALVKMYATDQKTYKDSLGKLTYFLAELLLNYY